MNESEFWFQCQSRLLLCHVVAENYDTFFYLCNTPLGSRLLFFAASSSLVSLRMSWWAIASLRDASSRSRSSHWRSFFSREISLWACSKREGQPGMMLMPCDISRYVQILWQSRAGNLQGWCVFSDETCAAQRASSVDSGKKTVENHNRWLIVIW